MSTTSSTAHATRTNVLRRRLTSVSAPMAALAAMIVARVGFGIATWPEVTFEGVARLLGVPAIFNLVHALPFGLDAYAKFVLFGVVIVGSLVAAIVLSTWAAAWSAKFGRASWWAFATLLPVAWLGLVVLPAQGLGWFGTSAANFAWPPLPVHLAAALSGLVFGVVSAPRPSAAFDHGRREVQGRWLRTVVGTWLASTTLGRFVHAQIEAWSGGFDAIEGLAARVTPTDEHYVVSKNVIDPNVRERDWSLTVQGRVERDLVLTLDDLRALPSVTRPSTLMCISNPVGGDLIGNSEWTGVKLADLLALAGPLSGAGELVLRGEDNYVDSFPIDEALREGTIVAYLQNGEPLQPRHGFPARVLVPGIYGMKNVKWVRSIEIVEQDVQGYWQTRGWSDAAVVRTMSRIDTNVATELGDGRFAIAGIAYAGLRGVAAVEVSFDGGDSWQACVVEPPVHELSWVRWAWVGALSGGNVSARVRAIDADGVVQSEVREPPLPDGASGYHARTVRLPS